MIVLGVTTRAVDDRRRRIICPDAADPALPPNRKDQVLRLALFMVAVVSALAFGLTTVSAKEHRSRAVTREFQREHPLSVDRQSERCLPRLSEGTYRTACLWGPRRRFEPSMADG